MTSPTSNLASILGENVINQACEKVDTKSLAAKKVIGIYFSAHWCPPCRAFTPQLAEFYNKHKESKSLEIIFCSADSDAAAFKEYFASMPWLAFSFADEETKVRARFKVLKLV